MYGSIFRMKVKPGKEQELKDVFKEWESDRKPKIQGTVHSFVMKPDNKQSELMGIAIFPDKTSYKTNAEDPEQDKWYKNMRELLEDDPEWEDGEFIFGD
jgi:quinol monooxygenase YgiN